MLQQTRVTTVIPYFEKFIQRYPTLEELAAAEIDEVLDLWTGLGYYTRARNLHKAAQLVRDEYGGQFPSEYQEALNLPGVGPYSAAAILSLAYGQPYAVFDGNVRRFLIRYLGLRKELKGGDVSALRDLLNNLAISPSASERISEFNQALMELGALVCKPGHPHCDECPLSGSCRGFLAGIQSEIPSVRKKRKTLELRFTVAVVRREEFFLMRRNEQDSYLRGLWEFPKIPGRKAVRIARQEFHQLLGLKISIAGVLPPVIHQITFRKIFLYPLLGVLSGEAPDDSFHWIRFGEQPVPTPSSVGKILRLIDTSG
jgi:A/G-specific adenine glycosylase